MGGVLQAGDFVSLKGDLGAGKTLFVKGIADALGYDSDDVNSPTFTLVQEYEGHLTIYHLDIYRLEDPEEELLAIGFEEFFEPLDGVTLVEWGDRAQDLLPEPRFEVHLDKENGNRHVRVFAVGHSEERLNEVSRVLSLTDRVNHCPDDPK